MAQRKLQIETSEAFLPLLAPARYKGAYGGRGSGKSHFFAQLAVAYCVRYPGRRIVCVREVQKSLKESVKLLIQDKIKILGVEDQFNILYDRIEGPNDGLIIFAGMQDHTAESIKSLEGFHVAYVEEAQTLTARSLEMLRPTIRMPGSELWFSWNPGNKHDPVDALLRGSTVPPDSVVVKANYTENDFFPDVLEEERLFDKEHKADRYGHIWDGDYEPAVQGAIYEQQLIEARAADRIGVFKHDTAVPVDCWFDWGRSDATAIWFVQLKGNEYHFIDYWEGNGYEPVDIAAILDVKERQTPHWRYGQLLSPHDGNAIRQGMGNKSLVDMMRDHGYPMKVVSRDKEIWPAIQNVRQMFPRFYFDEHACADGIEALKSYRKEIDEKHSTPDSTFFYDKPVHDWSSHGADALRTGCSKRETDRTFATRPTSDMAPVLPVA